MDSNPRCYLHLWCRFLEPLDLVMHSPLLSDWSPKFDIFQQKSFVIELSVFFQKETKIAKLLRKYDWWGRRTGLLNFLAVLQDTKPLVLFGILTQLEPRGADWLFINRFLRTEWFLKFCVIRESVKHGHLFSASSKVILEHLFWGNSSTLLLSGIIFSHRHFTH